MINLIVDILLPPASLAVVALLLSVIGGRRTRMAAIAVLVVLVGLGMPIVSTALLNSLSPAPQTTGSAAEPAGIVILSADAIRLPLAGAIDPGPLTLDRLRAGAALARRTGLPILVSGGPIFDSRMTLAAMMQTSLRDDFHLSARWEEDRSLDTWENAKFSAEILQQAGIHRVYLVTHDWHMRRALIAFRHFGLDPVPVPVRPAYTPPFSWRYLIINPAAWFNSYVALHEWVGLLYYNVRQ